MRLLKDENADKSDEFVVSVFMDDNCVVRIPPRLSDVKLEEKYCSVSTEERPDRLARDENCKKIS